jgi:ubiquinone/menaquinone biosynthesis C-methylase UbiE
VVYRTFIKSIIVQIKKHRALYSKNIQKGWEKEGYRSVLEYWEKRNDDSKLYLLDKLKEFNPSSVLEIGSNCGNNLFRLAKAYPNAEIVGIDINPLAVELGNKWLKENGINNVSLRVDNVEDLESVSGHHFDVVFSWAVLMYIHPKRILSVVNKLSGIANKGIVLIEMHKRDLKNPLGEFHSPANWKRDYLTILKSLDVDMADIRIESVPSHIWNPSGGGASFIRVDIC